MDPSEFQREQFRDLLTELSNIYSGSKYHWLRFLLYDHLPIGVLSYENTGIQLFHELEAAGMISCSNVTILSEIAYLTNIKAAISCIAEYTRAYQCEEGTTLTEYRKILFRVLMTTTSYELQELIAYYQLETYSLTDIWDVVFRLEIHRMLDDTPQRMKKFANCLNAKARQMILDYLEGIAPENTVPLEIFSRGSETLEAFSKALKDGKANINQGRLIVMGLERVGKTSTIKSFLKKVFNSEEPCTDGIAENKTYIEDSPDVWNEAPKDMSPVSVIFENEASEFIAKQLKKRKSRKRKQPSSSAATSSTGSLSSSKSSSTLTGPSVEEVPENIAIKAQELTLTEETTNRKTPNNAFILNIWDFGGQPIYSVIQRMLFASFANVCVVFNLEHDLDCRAWVRDPTTGEFYEHRMTYLDFIICCIRSVYMNRIHFDMKGIPPILLIGTHCNSDKLGKTANERKSKIRRIRSKILQALKHKPYNKLVLPKLFTIENSAPFHLSNASEIMEKIVTSSKKMVRRLPLKWLVFQQEIQKLKEMHICLKTSEIMELIKKCGINDEQQQNMLLDYLHNTGEILYYPKDEDLKDIVVVNLMKVVNLSTAIVTIKEPELPTAELYNAWERLNTGILEKHLLIYLWEQLGVKDELVDTFAILLQRFGLMCKKEVTEGQDQEFFVLSRLKPIPVEPRLTKYDEERAISFFHDFSNYLPDDVFQRGATKFIAKFQMKDPKATLRYEHVGLNIDEKHYVILNVVKIKQRRMFKTTILRIKVRKTDATSEPIVKHLPEKDDPERDVCRKVLKFIQGELSSLRPTDDEGVELKTHILCTCCESFHNVSDFNSDVLPCGMEGMDITRYRRLLGDDNQPVLAGVSERPTNTAEEVEEPGAKYARLGEEASSSTRDLRAPVDASSQPPDRSGNKKRKFRQFLAKLSDKYPGNMCRWLTFLLYNHLPIAVLSKTNICGMDLFNELSSRGLISFTNVTILSDISEVTGLVSAKQCVDAYRQETECEEGEGLTAFRKKLFKALTEVADSEIHKLVAYYNIGYLEFNYIWDLVFFLEKSKELDSRQQWGMFADRLNNVAKTMITDALALESINLQPTTTMETGLETTIAEFQKMQAKLMEAVNQETEARKAEMEAKEKAMKGQANATEANKAKLQAQEKLVAAETRAVTTEKQAVELEEKARAARKAATEAETQAREAEIKARQTETQAREAKAELRTAETVAENAESQWKEMENLREKATAELKEAETMKEMSMKAAKEAAAALMPQK